MLAQQLLQQVFVKPRPRKIRRNAVQELYREPVGECLRQLLQFFLKTVFFGWLLLYISTTFNLG